MTIAAASSGFTSSARSLMPLSAIIVDDEQLARDELAYLLKNAGDVNVVAQGKNGLEAVSLIKEHNPDLVFLDVQMPGLDGFGVIKKLLDRKVPLPKIVFATAFDQYAVKAFEVNAVDYILKPFDKKRVAQSIERARLKIEAGAGPEEKFETLVRMLESQKPADGQDREDSDQGGGKVIPDRSQGYLLCDHRRWRDHGGHQRPRGHGRPVQLPHAGRTFRQSRSQLVLAGAPVVSGQHQSYSRSRALVQEFLPVAHG
jgi:CheY-like chemotaxis protein